MSVATKDPEKEPPQESTPLLAPVPSTPVADTPARLPALPPMSMALPQLGAGLGLAAPQRADDSTASKSDSPPPAAGAGRGGGREYKRASPAPKAEMSSAELLADLVTPKVFPGPEVDLQTSIIEKLEKALPEASKETATAYQAAKKKIDDAQAAFDLSGDKSSAGTAAHYKKRAEMTRALPNATFDRPNLYVGSIVLSAIPADPDDDAILIRDSHLEFDPENALNAQENGFPLGEAAGVQGDIVRNTLATMITAGQVDYLRKAGFVGDGYDVVVEVHYYRKRDKKQANLHKDTVGDTLFVNLNYANTTPIAGPEIVRNPPPLPMHEDFVAKTLPEKFRADLKQAKDAMGDPTEIDMTPAIPPGGVVSFVDEAVHHATPFRGHRSVRPAGLRKFLQEDKDFKDLYAAAAKAWSWAHPAPGSFWACCCTYPFGPQMEKAKVDKDQIDLWENLLAMCDLASTQMLDRTVFAKAGLTPDQILRLVSGYAPVDAPFTSVNISAKAREGNDVRERFPMTKPGESRPMTLVRQASAPNLSQQQRPDDDPTAPRRFFRTWVRVRPAKKSAPVVVSSSSTATAAAGPVPPQVSMKAASPPGKA